MGRSRDKVSIFVRVFLSEELVCLVGLAIVTPHLEISYIPLVNGHI